MGQRLASLGIGMIVLLGLVARLGWGLSRPTDPQSLSALPDQLEYLQLGDNLRHGKGLAFYDPTVNDTLHAYRMPGYPALVAICHGDVRAIRIVQSALDASTILAVYLLARRWLAHPQALLAAGIVAVNPLLIFFSALVLSETLFTALLVWGMVLMIRPAWVMRCLGAVLLVGSIYARPSAIGLPVMVGVLSALARVEGVWTRKTSRLHLPVGAAMILLTVTLLFPWALRNRSVVGSWTWTTTNSGFTAYDSFNPYADGSSNQGFFRSDYELKEKSEVGRSRYLSEMAWQYAASHPGQVVWLAEQKLGRLWSPVPLSAQYGSNRMYWGVGLAYSVPLFALTLWGLARARMRLSVKLFLLSPAIYLTVLHAIFVGSLRYRVPAEAPMAVLAAAGVGRTRKRDLDELV